MVQDREGAFEVEAEAEGEDTGAPDLPLPAKSRFFYALGQAAEGVKNESFGLFLLFYYTNVLGLSGILAGRAILIALIFDAVTDPLVGSLSDRTHSRWGRRHPYMLVSALPLGFFFYAVFAPPEGLAEGDLFLWMVVFTVLTRAAMTLFHVPHLSLGAELSTHYEERTLIVTERTIASRLGGAMPGLIGLLWFMRATDAYPDGRFNPSAYPDFALVASVSMVLVILLSWWGTRSRIPLLTKPAPVESGSGVLSTMISEAFQALRLRSFRALFFGSVTSFVAWGVVGTMGLHSGTFFWKVSVGDLVIWGFAAGISIFVGLLFWSRAASRWDKKPVFLVGIGIFVLFTTPPDLLRIFGYWPELGSPFYLPMFVITTGVIANFGIAATMVTGGSMMADITDEDELRTGRRREGVYFGAVSFAAKAAFGLGGLIAGMIVEGVGVTKLQSPEEATAEIVFQLGLAHGLIILALITLGAVVFSRYDLSRARHGEIRAALEQRSGVS
ncbi:MAG: hypothetical protein GY723_11715 [bacterium]|nr:hypothetical protein [bacterium]MCP5065092.1 hypothetical protein [bacterium]